MYNWFGLQDNEADEITKQNVHFSFLLKKKSLLTKALLHQPGLLCWLRDNTLIQGEIDKIVQWKTFKNVDI